MSWSELERLVDQAEVDASLRRSLKGCRSTPELILAARRLGYRIPAWTCSGPGRKSGRSTSGRPRDE
jgi:hypothetical protein